MPLILSPNTDPYVNDRVIQNALYTGVNRVTLEAGTWRVTQNFVIPPATTLDGEDLVGTVLSAQTAQAGISRSSVSGNGYYGGWLGNFTFEGNHVANLPIYVGKSSGLGFLPVIVRGAVQKAIYLDAAQNLVMQNPIIETCDGDGLVLDAAAGGITIVGGDFRDCGGYVVRGQWTHGYGGNDANNNGPNTITFLNTILEWQANTNTSGLVYIGAGTHWRFQGATIVLPSSFTAHTGTPTLVTLRKDVSSPNVATQHIKFYDANWSGPASAIGLDAGASTSAYFFGETVMRNGANLYKKAGGATVDTSLSILNGITTHI